MQFNKSGLAIGQIAPSFSLKSSLGTTISLDDYRYKKDLILLFMRYLGWPVCKYELVQLKKDYPTLKAKDIELLAVLQSPRDKVVEFAKKHGLPFPCLADPEGDTYKLYFVPNASWGQYLSPKVFLPVLKATFSGFFHGKFEGEERQLPGLFLIDKKGVLRFKYIGQHPADTLSIEKVLREIDMLKLF